MNVDWKEVGTIAAAGAAGGFLSWASNHVLREPEPLEWWKSLPLLLVLGAGAATMGVYFLFNVDMRAPTRALFFAMLCGFSWKPVLEGGGALIRQKQSDWTARTNLAEADASKRTLESAGPEAEAAKEKAAEEVLAAVNAAKQPIDGASPAMQRKFEKDALGLLDLVLKEPPTPAIRERAEFARNEILEWKLRRRGD